MAVQVLPSQRSQASLRVVGLFVQAAACSSSDWPSTAKPVIVGLALAAGAAGSTAALAAEVAGAPSPVALLALTRTRIVRPDDGGGGGVAGGRSRR